MSDYYLANLKTPVFILYFFISAYTVVAQTFNFTNYGLTDGLSQGEVRHILEDNKGNLWLSTHGGGLNKFNGIDFKPITTFDGLSNNNILCSYQDKDQILWIGTEDGLNRYDGLNVKTFFPKNHARPFIVSHILTYKEKILIASNRGLFTIVNNQLKPYPVEVRFDYLSFLLKDPVDPEQLCFGIENKIYVFNDGILRKYDSADGLGERRFVSAAFLPDGNMIVASYGGYIFVQKGDRFEQLMPGSDVHGKFYSHLFVDSQNKVWISTSNSGIYTIDLSDSSVLNLTTEQGLANNHVDFITEDNWRNIWIGTGGSGLSKYHKTAFSQLTDKSLPADWIYSVACDSADRVWIGAGSEGITVLTDSSITTSGSYQGFVNAKVRLLFKDKQHRMWLAPEGKGLWVYDSAFHRIRSDLSHIEFDHIKSICQDTSDNFWICEGGKGLLCFKYTDSTHTIQTLQHIRKRDGLPSDYIYALHSDAVNRIWFGTRSSGSGYIYDGSIEKITIANGLASNTVSMITEDNDGYIWLAGGDGISRISAFSRNFDIRKFGLKDGIKGIPVFQILHDPEGYLWIGTSNGVTRFNLENGQLSNSKHFGLNEGFLGLETNTNAICRRGDGKAYFGTGKGLMVYEGETEQSGHPPVIHIKQINLFYEPIGKTFPSKVGTWHHLTENIRLNHDQNNLSFEFFAVNHNNPEAVQYAWFLEGFEQSWSPYSDQTVATYSNLPPGNYIFKVKAINAQNIESGITQTRQITILSPPPPPPPFYRQTWFILLVSAVGLIILILLGAILYTRITRERERIKMERNLLELEQKALRLQMNPHFIFNALNTIQGLITKQDTKAARRQLARFSKLMRQILDNSRLPFIPLSEEVATLDNYMAIEKMCSSHPFTYTINVDESIDTEALGIPPMMIQPFIENAIIHGLKNKEDAGKLNIQFNLIEDLLECIISDNGIGRKAAAKIKSQIEQQHKSKALIVTQERLEILHQNKDYPTLELRDKQDDAGNATGTEIRIYFPLTYIA